MGHPTQEGSTPSDWELYRFEDMPCPLCQAQDRQVLGEKAGPYGKGDGYHRPARVVRCGVCGLIYVHPMPIPVRENLVDLYNESYTAFLSDLVPFADCPPDFVDIVEGHYRLGRLEAFRGGPGRLLDIGCGPGNLLCVARERGWNAMGVEVNEPSACFAREQNGAEVVVGTTDDMARSFQEAFDAVHFNQVLEHTYDPRQFLASISAVLKPGGLFFCGVPKETSLTKWAGHYFCKVRGMSFTPMLSPLTPPYHLLGFSENTIQRLLRESGFVVLAIERVGYYPSVRWNLFRERQLVQGLGSIVGCLLDRLGDAGGLDVYGGKPPLRVKPAPRPVRRRALRSAGLLGTAGR